MHAMKIVTTVLVFCVGALVAIGLVVLYSAGMLKGEQGAQFFLKQLTWCGIGLVAGTVAASMDYRVLQRLAWFLFLASIVLLVLVLIPGIGVKKGGARRWFNIHGTSFQPSELAKLALIVLLAWYGERYQRHMRTFGRGIVAPGIIVGLCTGLIFFEPDVGTTLLMAAVAAAMLLVAGIRWFHFLPPVLAGIAAVGLFLWHDPMRSSRIYSWMHLEETKMGIGLQAWQAKLALGSGGIQGLGLGNGRQKLGAVPEHETDFIFSVVGEELGLIATLAVVVLFVVIVICGAFIAWNSRSGFGLLMGTGITVMIGLQALINIGVVTGALPNKGLPLPFISYGGSNLLMMLTCVGILLSLARHADGEPNELAEESGSTSVVAPQMS